MREHVKMLVKGTLIFFFVLSLAVWLNPGIREVMGLTSNGESAIERAYANRASNIIVETQATVRTQLPDLEERDSVQILLVELVNGHQLRVKHNTDLAASVPVQPGSTIRLKGEYDWTPNGGVIHLTHMDPHGEREGGWIEHEGRRYF